MYVTLVPAYGRDYKSAKEVKADWDANKDFRIDCMVHPYDGKFINKSQAVVTNDKYIVRFCKLTKTCNV